LHPFALQSPRNTTEATQDTGPEAPSAAPPPAEPASLHPHPALAAQDGGRAAELSGHGRNVAACRGQDGAASAPSSVAGAGTAGRESLRCRPEAVPSV